jgi:hypothetical protein
VRFELPAPPELAEAQAFCLARWQERAQELDRAAPQDLAGACKFCALFARALYGGEIRANWFHTWLELEGTVIDLTDAAGVSPEQAAGYAGSAFFRPWHAFQGPYTPDPEVESSPDFNRSLADCQERIEEWLAAFAAGQQLRQPL